MGSFFLNYYIKQNGKTITEELAREIVKTLPITDGSKRDTGEKWTVEESKEIGNRLELNWNDIPEQEFYIVINFMYSEFFSVGIKHGFTDYSFYAELSVNWFNSKIKKENKTFNYFVL